MPPSRRGVVHVSPRQMGCDITRLLQRHRCIVEEAEDDTFDFIANRVCVLYVDNLHRLDDLSFRAALSERVASLAPAAGAAGRQMNLLLLCRPPDPRRDALTWLSLCCGVERRCNAMICASEEECAHYVAGLAEAAAASLSYNISARKESTPIPVLIEAFTQTPQLMTRLDVVRAANRLGTPAKLLTATEKDLASLPGFGPKKAARLHAVLHAGFYTSRQSISDVLPSTDGQPDVRDAEETTRQRAKEKMLEELMKMRDREMDDTIDNAD